MARSIFTATLILACLPAFGSAAQRGGEPADTLTSAGAVVAGAERAAYARYAVPATLVAYGALTRVSKPLQELDHSLHRQVQAHVARRYTFDDYLQYAPAVMVYALSGTGVTAKARHSALDQTIVLVNAYLLAGAIVQPVKHLTRVPRPNAGASTSFPSGHTTVAFVGAHVLHREYRHISPCIGGLGYLSAATVGAFRMVNQRHWFSDVVAGAGLGILCAEAGYAMLPVCRRVLAVGKKGEKASRDVVLITPVIGADSYGAGFAWIF